MLCHQACKPLSMLLKHMVCRIYFIAYERISLVLSLLWFSTVKKGCIYGNSIVTFLWIKYQTVFELTVPIFSSGTHMELCSCAAYRNRYLFCRMQRLSVFSLLLATHLLAGKFVRPITGSDFVDGGFSACVVNVHFSCLTYGHEKVVRTLANALVVLSFQE